MRRNWNAPRQVWVLAQKPVRCRRFWNPFSRYRDVPAEGCDAHVMLRNLRQLEEEETRSFAWCGTDD